MTRETDDPASAASAWARGREGGADAGLWLARARRLAPDDPRIALDLARHELNQGNASAAQAAFAALAARHDIAAAWMGLALAAQQAHESRAAAAALDSLLTRHCLPRDAAFAAFAGHIAAAAGYDGYRGMTMRGNIRTRGAGRLLGAALDTAALTRVDGLAAWERGGVSGWASRLAAPDAPPRLTLVDVQGRSRLARFSAALPPDDDAPFLPRYRFRIAPWRLRGAAPPFRLTGPDGRDIMGSPIDPRALQATPIPATQRGMPPQAVPAAAPLTVLVPVYRGLEETKACLDSVSAALPSYARLLVVDDATPEPGLAAWLDQLAAQGRIILRRHDVNQGFCAAVNTGLAEAQGQDVLLLNSDTLVPPGVLETLRAIAYSDAATGSVTPLSNEAAICSYPSPRGENPMPDLAGATRLNDLARQTNKLAAIEIPTGIGFCLYLRHDCLAATGKLRGEIFAQGYGEENDFCLRARMLGFRHMAAPGAFVAHAGAVSFRAAARGLLTRNLAILNNLYPGYHEMVMAHIQADPLAPYRAALDEARLRAECQGAAAVLLISHSHGGGVARQVAAEMAALRAQGLAPLMLSTQFPQDPAATPYPWPALLCAGDDTAYPNLAFPLPAAWPELLRLLRELRVERVVLHHMLGHAPALRGLAAALHVPQDIVVHDYASFCPRVTLLAPPAPGAPPRYCGEPNLAGCIACAASGGAGFSTPCRCRPCSPARRRNSPRRRASSCPRRMPPAGSPGISPGSARNHAVGG